MIDQQLHYTFPKTTSLATDHRIQYKLSLIIHKAIHYNTPDFSKLSDQPTTFHTRSSNIFPLQTPHYTTLIRIVDALSHYLLLTTGIHFLNIYESSLQHPHLKNT